ncbi:MAG: adenylate/guanylate cyclase domain-containing protein [Actinomycetales bacterium]|nr:adenylate/guanylate cyclase domain-containing protein [Actinomycetales bacterium]
MSELDEVLLGGSRVYSERDLAQRSGVPLEHVHDFWRTLGLPVADPDARQYTGADVDAVHRLAELTGIDGLDWRTVASLTRATGHSADRLALWHVEALVEDFAARYELDDISARLVVLDHLTELAPVLEAQLVHAWRRQLAAVAGRIGAEFAEAHAPDQMDRYALPLARAVGFADMVSFTRLTASMDYTELAGFVQRFENAARDVVTAEGGRVVKTIGDAVLFVADDARAGARIATGLAAGGALGGSSPVEVRVSVVWGRVLSRFGDVFGPDVNLAARLSAVAEPGSVLTDPDTAELLAVEPDLAVSELAATDLVGFGSVTPFRVTRV